MHLASTRRNWPGGRGFERFYGFLGAETDQWHPDLVYDNHPVDPPAQPEDGYHLTEDLTDKALEFIKDAKAVAPDKPFFLYYAPGACHAPHQAPREWIDKYKGRFDLGYEAMRDGTLARQKQLGIVPDDTKLPALNPIGTPETRSGPDGKPFPAVDVTRPWDSLSDDERRLFSRMAEVYAGFLAHADHQIGRLLDYLEETDQLQNTLIVLVSDNGASGEGGPNGSVNENKFFNGVPDDVEANLALLDDLGSPKTYNHYPNGWAMAFNTPFKMWKRYEFNGGTTDPCIISWPKEITAAGEIRHQYHHAIDIVPTVLDCLGVEAPETIKGHVQSGFDGVSMRYSFNDADAPGHRKTQFYSMLGSRGIWHEGWKAISTHPTISGWSHFNDDTWELYNVEVDRAEVHDLADQHPDKVRELVNLWFAQAGANGAFPLDDRSPIEILNTPRPQLTSPRDRYLYYPETAGVPEAQAVNIRNRNYIVGAVVDIPGAGRLGRAVLPGLAFRRPRAVRQGRAPALRLQLRRDARAARRRDRGRPDRREPDPVRVVREGRRGPARHLDGHRVPVPRRRQGGGGADQDPGRGVRALRDRPDRRPGDQQRHRRLPGTAAMGVHRRHDPDRRGGRQRRSLRRPRARRRSDDRARIGVGDSSARLLGTQLAQPPLGSLRLTFELLQAGVRARASPVELGSQQSDPLPVVPCVGLCQLELAAGAHGSNSTTEYALLPRTSRMPAGIPPSGLRQTTNGRRSPMSKIASTMPPRSGSGVPTSVMQSMLPRRVHSFAIRRALGRAPSSSSTRVRISTYARSTTCGSVPTPGMKNVLTAGDHSPRLRASSARAAPIAPGSI